MLNFPISDLRYPPGFIHILGRIKRAAARTNVSLELLDPGIGEAIVAAAGEVAEGKLDGQFPVDLFQTGSGTSTNTNANEVIARRANELSGQGSEKRVHPNDHVNMGQSSNDVIPTATHLAAAEALQSLLLPALERTRETLQAQAKTLWGVIKTGRTHLQDATPIRLGQEFQGYADQLLQARERLQAHMEALGEVALGGTAVGTGVNAHPEFAGRVCSLLSQEMDLPVKETPYHFQAQGAQDTLLAISGAVRSAAVSLQKNRQRPPLALVGPAGRPG